MLQAEIFNVRLGQDLLMLTGARSGFAQVLLFVLGRRSLNLGMLGCLSLGLSLSLGCGLLRLLDFQSA